MTKPHPETAGHPGPTYEVRLRGHLNPRWATRLAVPTLTQEADGTTTLRGVTEDQAGLHGLLQRVRDLGLTLISVIRVDPAQPTPAPTDAPNQGTDK
jgi:hypothetical protein